jgi:DNA-binding response OmpR family regulator
MAKKILLIESNAGLIRDITGSLEGKGFEVVQTADGKEGIDLARQHSPDLIILCVELPKASGYSICSKLKKDDVLRSIPIILTSAEATQKTFDDHRRLKMGRADEYLLMKPFKADALIEKVSGLIGLPEAGPDAGDGLPTGDEALDISGLAEEVAGEEQLTLEEVEEISVEAEDVAPTPESLPGDEDLAMLDAAFEGIEDKKHPEGGNGHAEVLEEAEVLEPSEHETAPHALPGSQGEDEDLLAMLDSPPPVAAPEGAASSAEREELEQLRSEVSSLKQQLESTAEAKPAGATKDKEYFAAKEKLATREKELLKLRDESNAKDKELIEQRDKEMALEQQISEHGEQLAKRDAQIKTLQQKIDALVAGQKRSERDLTAARDEARQASTKMQAAEQELSTVRSAATEHEATAQRVTGELETATGRVSELESEIHTERSRTDELSAELNGTRIQLEEAQSTLESLRHRITDLEDQGSKNEERIVKAYQKINGDERLKDKVKKALGIAQQLLDEAGLSVGESSEESRE